VIIRGQNPIRLSHQSEPLPDLIVLKYREDYYRKNHPTADDVYLLVEVADSSIDFDRRKKIPLYAKHNIPEYWIINLTSHCIEVYRRPAGGQYNDIHYFSAGQSLAPQTFPDLRFSVSHILG